MCKLRKVGKVRENFVKISQKYKKFPFHVSEAFNPHTKKEKFLKLSYVENFAILESLLRHIRQDKCKND